MSMSTEQVASQTCPVCKGEKKLVGRLAAPVLEGAGADKAHIWCDECGGAGAVPTGPQGDLAAWLKRMQELVETVERPSDMSAVRDHLAAMPQAQPDTELLKALRGWQESEAKDCPDCDWGPCERHQQMYKDCREMRDTAIAQAETGEAK